MTRDKAMDRAVVRARSGAVCTICRRPGATIPDVWSAGENDEWVPFQICFECAAMGVEAVADRVATRLHRPTFSRWRERLTNTTKAEA